MMDLKIKGSEWVGNIYQKFEAICIEVDDIVKQTFKYVEDQMQSVSNNVKKLCSGLLPPLGIPVKPVAEYVATEKIVEPVAEYVATEKIVEPVLSKLTSPGGEEPSSELSYEEFVQSSHENKSSRDYLYEEAKCVSGDTIESLQNWNLWDDHVDEVERIHVSLQSIPEMSFSVVSMENAAEDASLAFFIRCDAEESSIISESSPENATHEEMPYPKSIEGAAIVSNFFVAAHEALEHRLECQVDSAFCDSVDSSVVCSVVSEDTSIEKIGVTSFDCSNAKTVELSEYSSQNLLMEAILRKYVDVSSSDTAYCHTESIDLLDKMQIQENCLNVEDSVLRAISQSTKAKITQETNPGCFNIIKEEVGEGIRTACDLVWRC